MATRNRQHLEGIRTIALFPKIPQRCANHAGRPVDTGDRPFVQSLAGKCLYPQRAFRGFLPLHPALPLCRGCLHRQQPRRVLPTARPFIQRCRQGLQAGDRLAARTIVGPDAQQLGGCFHAHLQCRHLRICETGIVRRQGLVQLFTAIRLGYGHGHRFRTRMGKPLRRA